VVPFGGKLTAKQILQKLTESDVEGILVFAKLTKEGNSALDCYVANLDCDDILRIEKIIGFISDSMFTDEYMIQG